MMRVLFIAFVVLLAACGGQNVTQLGTQDLLRDTAIFVTENRGDLIIHHYYSYDSLGRIEFETAHVTAYDTITSVLTTSSRGSGSSFAFDSYLIWTPVASHDTFMVMTGAVRMGEFLCFRDTTLVRDAVIIERRTEGYGTYENAGFLIVPEAQDTILIWSLVDNNLPRSIMWDWNGLVPMSLEKYQAYRTTLGKSDSVFISQKGVADSLVARANWVKR